MWKMMTTRVMKMTRKMSREDKNLALLLLLLLLRRRRRRARTRGKAKAKVPVAVLVLVQMRRKRASLVSSFTIPKSSRYQTYHPSIHPFTLHLPRSHSTTPTLLSITHSHTLYPNHSHPHPHSTLLDQVLDTLKHHETKTLQSLRAQLDKIRNPPPPPGAAALPGIVPGAGAGAGAGGAFGLGPAFGFPGGFGPGLWPFS